jgi:ketosteroid isomerase-like protein
MAAIAEKTLTELLKRTYDAFNRRDIDEALSAMTPDVEWPNGMEGGTVHGYDGIRAYWTRQWGMIDPHVDPVAFTPEPSGTIAVEVHQLVRDLSGKVLLDRMVDHVYFFNESLISRMEIRE